MRYRPLGNPTNKAWLAGWDAGVVGLGGGSNPYRRRPQRNAWEQGRACGLRSNRNDVAIMQHRLARHKGLAA